LAGPRETSPEMQEKGLAIDHSGNAELSTVKTLYAVDWFRFSLNGEY
jgi:hypothetical protein